MRFLVLLILCLTGCAQTKMSKASKQAAEQVALLEKADSRAVEEARMRQVTSEIGSQTQPTSGRGAQIMVFDKTQTFDPSQARFGRPGSVGTKAAQTNSFFTRKNNEPKPFSAGNFSTKNASVGDTEYSTKAATTTKDSWFSRLTKRTKTYDTRTATEAPKAVAVRGAKDGERPFLIEGRRQAEFDRKGPGAMPPGYQPGYSSSGPAWSGGLYEVRTIDDVKALLNKN